MNENCIEDTLSMDKDWKDGCILVAEDLTTEIGRRLNDLTMNENYLEGTSRINSSLGHREQEEISMEEDVREDVKNTWFEDHGLTFPVFEPIKKCRQPSPYKKHRFLHIVMAGKRDSGKTELVEGAFGDHRLFSVSKRPKRIEYHTYLGDIFHIWMYDAEDTDFVRKANILERTVFLFCFDADNPESFANLDETWIPAVLERSVEEMFFILVGVRRNCESKSENVSGINTQGPNMTVVRKRRELCGRFRAGLSIDCFIGDKRSLLNVFQNAIDIVFYHTQ